MDCLLTACFELLALVLWFLMATDRITKKLVLDLYKEPVDSALSHLYTRAS